MLRLCTKFHWESNERILKVDLYLSTRKTVLDRGLRSDRPRYCVTTPIGAEH